MTVADKILQMMEELPPEKQQELLDFAERLLRRHAEALPRRSSRGLWAGLGIDISEKDIEDVRREIWAGFPRDDQA